jgi:RHS repeat-associated protein
MTAEFRRLVALLLFGVVVPVTTQAAGSKDFCPIYPIGLPQQALDGKQPGDRIEQLPRGSGPGNFNWLTWTGANDAPTLAQSLVPPGNSDRYVNPADASDTRLDIGDWAQGAPGSMNAKAVRDNLDALKSQDIIVPEWEAVRGQGSHLDYRVRRFVTIRLAGYRLTGQGWLSFEYRGEARCYNQPPVALPQTLFTDEDTALPILLEGSDPEGDALGFRIVEAPQHGRLDGEAPSLVYVPDADYSGADRFTFLVADAQYDSAPVEVGITVVPVNDAPLADAQTLATDEDTPLPITLTGSDVEGDALTWQVVRPPEHARLEFDGSFWIYTPAPDFYGADSFTAIANDGALNSAPATIAIEVRPVNDAPVAGPQSLETIGTRALNIVLSASDVEGDVLSYHVVTAPEHGGLTGEGANLVYVAGEGFAGNDRFEFVATDGALDSEPVAVDIHVKHVNRAPEIVSTPSASVNEGAVYHYDVNAVDPDQDPLAHSSPFGALSRSIDPVSGVMTWRAESTAVSGTRGSNLVCRPGSVMESLDFAEKWHWLATTAAEFADVESLPIVLQTNDDNGDGRIDALDTPDVAFVAYADVRGNPAVLRTISGDGGRELQTFNDPSRRLAWAASPAAGDLDGDGVAEIVVMLQNGGVLAYKVDGSRLWERAPSTEFPRRSLAAAAPLIVDLDQDGAPEVVIGKAVLSNGGVTKWVGAGSFFGTNVGLSNADYHPVAADLLPSPGMEVIVGASAYAASGELLWQNAEVGDGYTAVADVTGDGQPEVVVVSQGRLSLLDAHGRKIWGPVNHPGQDSGGHPVIADVDGDGYSEIGIGGRSQYAMFNHDGSVLWLIPVQDTSGGAVNGSAVFDFDGDDVPEVLVIDNFNLFVVDGRTGTVRHREPASTGTGMEYPVVADIDNDGQADLLMVANADFTSKLDAMRAFRGVKAFQSGSQPWPATRSIWNQHAYHIDNINDDGTVPRQPAKSWLTHNTFRLNTFPDRHPLGLADLALFDLRLDESNGTAVKLLVVNRGLAPTEAPTWVRIFNGDPDGDGHVLGTLEVPVLAAGEEITLTLAGLAAEAVNANLHARIDEDRAISECLDNNNQTTAVYFEVRAADPHGLYDSQRFTVSVENVNEAPRFVTEALPVASINDDYRYTVLATDPDLGDGLLFSIQRGPAGLRIDQASGKLFWRPTPEQAGDHSVEIRVNDLGGLFATRTFMVSVPANTAPRIISTPTTELIAGQIFEYDVNAVDDDGDVLVHALTTAPVSSSIDEDSGLVRYQTEPGVEATLEYTVLVDDGRGGQDVQSFVVNVRTSPNSPPSFISAPVVDARVGATYSYQMSAFDVDDDDLTYRLVVAPPTMSIDRQSGLITWTPESHHLGLQPVEALVEDGRGGNDVQRFEILVAELVANRAPTIVSEPSRSVHEGADYSYLLRATDPDNDVLNYTTLTVPQSTELGLESGQLHWEQQAASQNSLRSPHLACRRPTAYSLNAGLETRWHWNEAKVLGTPLVGRFVDTNGDGVLNVDDAPNIAFLAFGGLIASSGATLVIVDAATGRTLAFAAGLDARAAATPAVADIDKDGWQEFVMWLRDGRVAAWSPQSGIEWVSDATNNPDIYNAGKIAIANIDAHGSPELLAREFLLDAEGRLLWQAPEPAWHLTSSFAVDLIDSSPGLEIVLGPSVYDSSGELVWKAPHGHHPAVADLDRDGNPELILVGGKAVSVYTPTGELVWRSTIPHGTVDPGGGSPTLADLDGDGRPEVVVATRYWLFAFSPEGSLLWQHSTSDSSRTTAASAWDLDGDGAQEVAYADSNFLFVLNGRTGRVIHQTENGSSTGVEYPVVAAIDQAGAAALLVTSDSGASTGIRALQPSDGSWAPTRAVWNQYDYHIDNINDDGTVPVVPAKSWLSHNTFRQNTFQDRAPLGLPDLAVFDLHLADVEGAALEIRVLNRGLSPTEAPSEVLLYNGDPQSGGVLLGRLPVPILAAGESQLLLLEGLSAAAVSRDLYATVDADQMIEECSEDNNWAVSALFDLRASDPEGLFDAQRFTVSVENVNEAPTIVTGSVDPAVVDQAYRFRLQASDPDLGDGLRWVLLSGPDGLELEGVSGELRWIPSELQAGTHPIAVRVTDLGGLSAQRSFTIVALSGNQSPSFTSQPSGSAVVGIPFLYTAVAEDPDGDALTYSVQSAPAEFSIDAATGVVSWTPTIGTPGSVEIELRADDGRGGRATQSFTVTVTSSGVNRAPQITSTPPASVIASELYRYVVEATDPDGDTLAVRLALSPQGMSLNEFSGEVRWVPAGTQIGVHPVTVEVDDFKGGVTQQSFEISVGAPAGNRAPLIESTPSTIGKVGKAYEYHLLARDPEGDAITATLITAPAGMNLASNEWVTWTPTAAGTFDVRVRVSDGQGYTEQAWSIVVLAASVPLTAQVDIEPDPVEPSAQYTLTLQTSGAAGPVEASATLDGALLALESDGVTALIAPATSGRYALVVTVTDGYDTVQVSRIVNVGVGADTEAPAASILSPREGAADDLLVVTAPQDVSIHVQDEELAYWMLGLVERGDPGGGLVEIASGDANVAGAMVGKLDPTLLQNGLYQLVLQAEDRSGNTTQDSVLISVEGAMKIGHFSISFVDLQVPVAGLPVTVTRSYDTRQRHKRLDFGYGWNVDYQSIRLQESRRPGFAWELKNYPTGPLGLIPKWCVEAALGNVVSVTLPDGEVEKFRPVAFPECNEGTPIIDVELRFEPMDGTKGRLKVSDGNFGRLINGSLADPTDPGTPLDPSDYVYTNAEGQDFTLEQGFTVREIHEHEGDNRVTFGFNGVVHSAGPSITFVRDAQGRISRVIAPDASEIRYQYDADGDLRAVVDANGGRTEFTYVGGHYLEDIIDPRGVRVARNEYDAEGRLIAVVDADGQRIEYSRDLDGRVEQVRDRNGHTTTYVYNDRGDVLAETNAEGETVLRSYDDNGNKLSESDPLGNTRSWTYDWLGNVLTDADPEGGVTRNTFGTFNQHETTTDPLGRVVTDNFYRNQTAGGVPIYPGPLVRIRDANGLNTSFDYSASSGELIRISDPSGASTRFEFDTNGFKTADIDAEGVRTEYVNDAMGRVLEARRTRTRADASTETLLTVYTRDAKGNVSAVTHPDGSVSSTQYDGNDKPIRECDALGRCTRNEYDNRGNVASITYPDGSVERRTYDANGNLLSQTDRNGAVTRFVYDRANRLIETIHPDATPANDSDNPRTRAVYDDAGRLLESIDENGAITRYAYDRAGRRVRTELPAVDGVVAVIRDEYDAASRRIASIDAEGVRTEYVYDNGGRLLETRIDGTSMRIEYDPAGRKVAEVDAGNRRTEYAYDRVGRLTQVTLAAGTAQATLTTYAYDELGNKIAQTDAEGHSTRWEYDAMGRETARILPGGQREERAYNAAGELIAHTDFSGQTTRYEYDSAGRLLRIDYPNDADQRFAYDANGQRTEAIDGRGASTTEYDARGRVLQSIDADGGQIQYQYDDAGNLMARISAHQSLQYRYDSRNRLIEVTRSIDGEPPSTTRYEYDGNGRRIAMSGGEGTRTEYAYDAKSRLRSLVKRSAAGLLLAAMSYQVDASGLRSGIEESDSAGIVRTVDYEYDALKRLTEERIDHRDEANDRTTSWTYDRVGNRLTQVASIGPVGAVSTATTTYGYDSNDRLLTETVDGLVTTYAYDANGNTKSKAGPDSATSYEYDDANRLVEATTPEGVTEYVYSADGLRVRQSVTPSSGPDAGTTTTTWYVQDSAYPYAQVIEQYEGDTRASKRITATYAFADDLVSQTRYDEQGTPATAFVQMDGFGSTRWVTDATGSITDSMDYDAFGVEINRSGETDIEHLYRGEAFDDETGLYYLRARWMDPSVGRFTQMDPFPGRSSDPLSRHRYQYAHLNPVMNSDPSGLETLIGLNSGVSANATLGLTARGAAQVTVNRVAGKAFENYVGTLLQRFVAQHGGRVFSQVRFSGPGGVRVADYVVQLGNRFIVVEAKTKIPLAGQALARLGGQLRTFAQGTTKVVPGSATEVIVITEETAAALEASFLTIESQVATGTISGILQGTNGLMTVLRGLLVL